MLQGALQPGQPFLTEFNPHIALAKRERERRLEDYFEFLQRRDGKPDVAAKTLTRREEFFAALDSLSVKWKGPLDRAAFHGNLGQPLKHLDLDRRIIWLLAAAKSN